MQSPLIGITAGNDPRIQGVYVLRSDYIRSIEKAGGTPIILAPSQEAAASGLIQSLHGILLSGGVDIDPSLYNETPHHTVTRISSERDKFEARILSDAFQRNLPILGICRGMQMLNVALKGSLIQDLPSCSCVKSYIRHDDPERHRSEIAHTVCISRRSLLHHVLGLEEVQVNSFHHQAIKRLGKGLVAAAWSGDGIIEAVESPGMDFCIGVQWHPESFWNRDETFAPLFETFVQAAQRLVNRQNDRQNQPVHSVA